MEAGKSGGGGHDAPPPLEISAVDRRENFHNGSVRCNLQDICIFRFSKIFLFYFILIMLIYARNQTFCSKSVNKDPKVQIFGLNSILSNCTWKKFWYQNQFLMYFIVLWIYYVFLSFFDLLFLFCFSPKFVADTFWSTINQKLINFSNWE